MSLEDHYTCDLVEVVVEIPCSNIYHGDSAQLQSSNASDVLFDVNDMSHVGLWKTMMFWHLILKVQRSKVIMSPVFKIHFVIICQLNRSFHVIPAFSHLPCIRLLTKLWLIWNTELMITQGEIITPTLSFCHVWSCGLVSNRLVVMWSGAGKEIFQIRWIFIIKGYLYFFIFSLADLYVGISLISA